MRAQSTAMITLALARCHGCEPGPIDSGDSANPCVPVVVSATDLGTIDPYPAGFNTDAARALPLDGEAVWLNFVLSEDNSASTGFYNHFPGVAARTADLDASDGISGWSLASDSAGHPAPLIPWGDSACGAPSFFYDVDASPYAASTLASAGGALSVFFTKTCAGGASGVGVATWSGDPAESAVVLSTSNADPELLFDSGDGFMPISETLAVDDGSTLRIYGYSCEIATTSGWECTLGRVLQADVNDRAAWTFWDGSGWSASLSARQTVLFADDDFTVHYSEFLGAYVAVYGDWASDAVFMRTAPAPEGPWSATTTLFNGAGSPCLDWTCIPYAGALPAYSGNGGETELVSYTSGDETRLVEVQFACQ